VVLFGLALAGHMLVANVAMNLVSPTTLSRMNDLITMLAQWYPMSPDIRQSACWADDLKSSVRSTHPALLLICSAFYPVSSTIPHIFR
jgi:hypothetical protein